jgi:hypothetical protein
LGNYLNYWVNWVLFGDGINVVKLINFIHTISMLTLFQYQVKESVIVLFNFFIK